MVRLLPPESPIGTFLNCSSLPRHTRNYSHYAAHGGMDEGAGDEELWDEQDAAERTQHGPYDG